MTLNASFVWKNADATKDLNARLKKVVLRGVVYGGQVTPGIGLNVVVDPSVAVSFDGMTVAEDQQQILPVVAGQNQYLCVWAKYNEGGSPATATLQWRVLEQSVYNAHAEKDYMIVYATVDVPAMAGSVLPEYIYFDARDEVNPLGRDWYRGRVANPAGLPLPPPHMNRIGDFYFVDSDHTFFFWNGSIWEPLNTGSYNTETAFMNKYVADMEQARFVEGSGVIAGIRPNSQGDFASDTEINIIETPAVADQVGIDAFTAIVNGHRVQTHAQYLNLGPHGGGDEYYLIYLEVWREAITVPDTFNYDRNPDGSVKYTLQEIEDKLENLEWKAGVPVAPTADNFNLNPAEPYDHDWRMVKWRIAFAPNMPSSICLYNPSDPTITAACEDFEGNPTFTSQPAGTGTDDRLWISGASTAADGHSWAIPLFVVRRTSAEVPPNAIKVFRDGVRYIFPVYPIADVAHSARKAVDTIYRNEPTPFTVDHYPYDEPSGFLSSMDFQIETKAGSDNVSVYEDQTHVRIRGIDDWIKLAGGPQVALTAAPAPSGSWERQLIYLKMSITLYENGAGTATTNQYVSQKHRPYIPSKLTGSVRAQGWKRGYVTFEYVAEDLGWNYLDEYDAMTAAGWTRGDLTMAANSAQYEDGGIWSRAVTIDADDRVHPYLTEWAIPICLIHRRNQAAWTFNTNPNGSTASRVDGRTDAAVIYPDDLVDLRHEVGVDENSLRDRLDRDITAIRSGQLRTRMANKWAGSAGLGGVVAGSRILQSDFIGNSGGVAFDLTPPDGDRRIWSDAKEFQVLARSFPLNAVYVDSLIDFDPGNYLSVASIVGSHLVRHVPAMVWTDFNTQSFTASPAWSTYYNPTAGVPNRLYAKRIESNALHNMLHGPVYDEPAYSIVGGALDSRGRPYAMTTSNVSSNTGVASLSWWVHLDRTTSTTDNYGRNYGLAEVPDTVHSVIRGPNGATPKQCNIGTLCASVRKTVSGSSVSITDADVQAATGVPGTVVIHGIDINNVFYSPSLGATTVTSVSLQASLDGVTIYFSGVYNGIVDVLVFYQTDQINSWVEIGRGAKSVRAMFEWNVHTYTGAAPLPSAYAYTLDQDVWQHAEVGDTVSEMPLIYSRSGAADWTMVITTNRRAAYPFSNVMALSSLGLNPAHNQIMVICPAHVALTSSVDDELLIHYTYTPYQGLSSTGGEVASSYDKLFSMLHGEVVEDNGFYATQAGPCSFYGGINAWTGSPMRNNAVELSDVGRYPPALESRLYESSAFSKYNCTQLVKASSQGEHSMSYGSQSSALMAAAVLRLPFVGNPAHLLSGGEYHKYTNDFDLDPGRAGVATGPFVYAPQYISTATTSSALNISDFVNGLSRLRVNGYGDSSSGSSHVLPGDFRLTSTSAGSMYIEYPSSGGFWEVTENNVPPTIFRADVTLPKNDADCLSAAVWYINSVNKDPIFPDMFYASEGTQIVLRDYIGNAISNVTVPEFYDSGMRYEYWTCPSTTSNHPTTVVFNFGTLMQYVSTYPIFGTIFSSAGLFSVSLHLFFQLVQAAGSQPIRKVYGIKTLSDANIFQKQQRFVDTGVGSLDAIDTVHIGFGSASGRHESTHSNVLSLKGKRIEYPTSWSPSMRSTLEGLLSPSVLFHPNYGRGVYLGNSSTVASMAVMLPGSTTSIKDICRTRNITVDQSAERIESIGTLPAAELFSPCNKYHCPMDHGGQLAYVFRGLYIKSSAEDVRNSVALQISGGATSESYRGTTEATAIDSFWPKGRPILKSKK